MRESAALDDVRRSRTAVHLLCLLVSGAWLGASALAQPGGAPSGRPPNFPPPGMVIGPRRQVGSSAVEQVTERIKKDRERSASSAAATPGSKGSSDSPQAEGASTKPESEGASADDQPAETEPKRPAIALTPAPPVGKGRVKALEVEAQQCKEASEALMLYKAFLSDPATTAAEKEQAQTRIQFWEEAAKDDLVRVGKKWYSRVDAGKLKEEADKLVGEAIAMLDVKNYKKADEKLEKASRVYPDHLESLFLLGVGAYLTDDIKGADKRFSQCLIRAPNHVPLLNNVALCAVLSKRFDRAVKHWEKAAAIEPENPVIAQNLGQFIADASNAKSMPKAAKSKANAAAKSNRAGAPATGTAKHVVDFANVDRHVLDDAAELYAKIVGQGKVSRADTTKGYYLLKLFQPKKGGRNDPSAPEEGQIVGNGSGFVIWDGYVLTNRHVVEDADSVVIQDPGNPAGDPLPGKIVAISKELDLAIVQCIPLMAPPAPVNAAPATRGTEVLALGFPVMSVVGRGLKATRGIITGVPSKDTGNLMVLDVQVNPGNSGGPLCDKSGQVMGIVAAKTFTERFVQGYGLAIPMVDALPFIKQRIPGFSESRAGEKKLEWTEVDAQISKSTVLVLIKKKKKA